MEGGFFISHISGISLSTIAHSTEDVSKVETAMKNLLPESVRSSLPITISEARGHHGNPISVLSLEIHDRDASKETADYILRLIPAGDKMRIRDRMDLYYDGRSSIFLRLDKQSAFQRSPRLSESDDVIRIRIASQGGKGSLSTMLKLFELE
jgi:hypothetical protein